MAIDEMGCRTPVVNRIVGLPDQHQDGLVLNVGIECGSPSVLCSSASVAEASIAQHRPKVIAKGPEFSIPAAC